MKTLNVFVDTDVVISSLISKTGGAYLLLNNTPGVNFWISDFSEKEIIGTINKLNLSQIDWKNIKNNFKYIKLDQNIQHIRNKYLNFILDKNDAQIVAGTVISQARYLLTYNLKHYQIEKIKELNIIVLTPGQFLQYLRSQN